MINRPSIHVRAGTRSRHCAACNLCSVMAAGVYMNDLCAALDQFDDTLDCLYNELVFLRSEL